jgi:lactate permease
VSFGALGTPVAAQVAATGLDGRSVGLATAALHAALGAGLVLALGRIAGGGLRVATALAAAAAFLLPALALAALAGPELPTLGGALLGGAAFALVLRRRGTRAPAPRGLAADLAPYLAVVALVLLTRLVPPLREALGGLRLSWELAGGFAWSMQPLAHPGTLLLAGLALSALATGRAGLLAPAFGAALRRLVPVALALGVMLLLARLMVHAGMIAALAQAAQGLGAAWPLAVPLVGVLGTFVTGSATASNILFSGFQNDAAVGLGLSPVAMAAGQGLGAAIGNAIAPHNIIAGAATVGLAGRDGAVLARTAGPVLAYALAAGALLLAWSALA